MTQDTTQNTTADQAAQTSQDAAQKAAQNATAQVPDSLELPPMLQTTDALEALMKKAAGQLN